ncbi:MAG: hypothetical protein ACXV45_07610 [Halobacteriota archaeon]
MTHERHEGYVGMQPDVGKPRDWTTKKMIWKQLDDEAKKQYLLRRLDEKVLKKECKMKVAEHKMETLRLLKKWIEQ